MRSLTLSTRPLSHYIWLHRSAHCDSPWWRDGLSLISVSHDSQFVRKDTHLFCAMVERKKIHVSNIFSSVSGAITSLAAANRGRDAASFHEWEFRSVVRSEPAPVSGPQFHALGCRESAIHQGRRDDAQHGPPSPRQQKDRKKRDV